MLVIPGGEPPSLDPAVSTDTTSAVYIVEIYSGLVKLDRNLRVQPDIAERWELSSDGKTYTFYLRKDVRFHDGRPATARDFKYSIERAADPALKSTSAETYLGDIVGVKDKLARRATAVSGVRVIDDYTVAITIAEPRAYFLAKLTFPTSSFVDQANVEQGGPTWFNKPNGTGPFKLLEYTRGQHIVLGANELFYESPPFVSRVEFVLGDTSMAMYEDGRLDTIGVGSASIDRVSDPSDPLNKQLTVAPVLSTQFVVFNTHQPPFDDPKVRQAFTLAIDREQIVKVAYRGLPLLANSILPPGMPGYASPPAPVYDPTLAKQLLAQSKYAGKLPDIVWSTSGTGGSVSPSLQAMVEMLKTNLGANVSVQQTEYSAFLARTHDPARGGMQMFSIGWSADYVDPVDFVDVLFRTGAENNYALYSNPAVDKLLDQAAQEKDLETRLKLYQQADRLILADYPVMPLNHGRSYILTKPYVKDLVNPAAVVSRLRYAWLSDDAPAPVAGPTPLPKLAPGQGGVIVDNFCGFDVTISIGGKITMIPTGGRAIISLAPGKFTVSANAPGHNLTCGGGGCGLTVMEGQYISYPYCAQ
jgi:oligopeptide transport system substrate-binding protein